MVESIEPKDGSKKGVWEGGRGVGERMGARGSKGFWLIYEVYEVTKTSLL